MPRPTPLSSAVTSALTDRLAALRGRIARAAERSGREASAVGLIAVTKSVDVEQAGLLLALGQLDLGENRVQELERKHAALRESSPAPVWHLIGHLQTNKARRAVELATAIHSVDSPRLLDTLERLATELGRRPRVYLEVKSDARSERSGVEAQDLAALVEHAQRAAHLELVGLMTLAPAPDPLRTASENSERARASFRALADLARALPREAFVAERVELSMGMSQDFEEAIAEGADRVRIGSALFADEESRP